MNKKYPLYIFIFLFLCEINNINLNEIYNNLINKNNEDTIVETNQPNGTKPNIVASNLNVYFINVGQADCILIQNNDENMLIDAGNNEDGEKLVKYFKSIGITKFKYVVGTHPHEDHIYDLPNLYAKLSPKVLQRPKEAFDIIPTQNTYIHQRIADQANEMNNTYNQPVNINESPVEASVNGGVEFDFVFPKQQWTIKHDLNTFSSIIVVKAFGYKFVLTGDNPQNILQNMMDENHENIKQKVKDATVLLAPHHGRTGEYCKDFFDCVNPYLTVVSDKSIEHSTQSDTAQVYKGRGANLYGNKRYVLTTRKEGTISFDVGDGYCNVDWGKENY